MKKKQKVWIFLIVLPLTVVIVGGIVVRLVLAKTPISLSSVMTTRSKSSDSSTGSSSGSSPNDQSERCQVTVSVARRDGLIGMTHGAPPVAQRAWLSDEHGKELFADSLAQFPVPPRDTMGGWQFGWSIAPTLPNAPATLLFHATFTAPGAAPYTFKQELHEGVDFNFQ